MSHFYTPWKRQKNIWFSDVFREYRNGLSANPAKWSNTLKQFVGNLLTSCLSVFNNFVRLALKRLRLILPLLCDGFFSRFLLYSQKANIVVFSVLCWVVFSNTSVFKICKWSVPCFWLNILGDFLYSTWIHVLSVFTRVTHVLHSFYKNQQNFDEAHQSSYFLKVFCLQIFLIYYYFLWNIFTC